MPFQILAPLSSHNLEKVIIHSWDIFKIWSVFILILRKKRKRKKEQIGFMRCVTAQKSQGNC